MIRRGLHPSKIALVSARPIVIDRFREAIGSDLCIVAICNTFGYPKDYANANYRLYDLSPTPIKMQIFIEDKNFVNAARIPSASKIRTSEIRFTRKLMVQIESRA